MPRETRGPLYVKLSLVALLAVLCGMAYRHLGLRLGLDLSGGVELLYRIRTETVPRADQVNITQRTIDVIRRRVDPRGTEQLDIRPRGRHRFYIQIPHREEGDAERIERRLQRAGTLIFTLVEDREEYRAQARRGEPVPQHTVFLRGLDRESGAPRDRYYRATFQELAELDPPDGDWLLVKNQPVTTGQYLSRVYPTVDESMQRAVGFELRGRGSSAFADATARHTGHRLAIILDDILYSAPTIQSRIAGRGQITGQFTEAEVSDLITTLQAGSLPADIELEWRHVVGPSLGQDSINRGVRAIVIGMVLVLVFMAVYYLWAGLVANLAVVLNLIFIIGVMAMLRVVLTLPGMAGLVLTIGMAVDANVLIYERIREELKRGKGLRLAIRSGYERAFITIVDSNLTTLITALILFGIGTGPVRGFAVTLSVGILASLFTSLVVTRLVFETLLEHNVLRRLPMMQFVKDPSFAFSKIRRPAALASVLLIAAGLTVFNVRGAEKYDNDLTGGIMADIELDTGMEIGEFRSRVASRFSSVDVQNLQEGQADPSGLPKRFLVRLRAMADDEQAQIEKIRRDFARLLERTGHGGGHSVEHVRGLEFSLRLDRPIDEGVLRAGLDQMGYRLPDIKALVAQTARSRHFILHLREAALDPDDPDKTVAGVLRALGDLVERRTVRIETVGRVESESPLADAHGRRELEWQLDFVLQDFFPPAAIREAIYEQALGGSRPPMHIASSSEAEDANEIRNVRVRAGQPVLERVRAGLEAAGTLGVAMFQQPAPGELHVTLQSEQSESAIHEQFAVADPPLPANIVLAVLPKGVEDDQFAVAMAPLREDKILEKVQEDLVEMFAEELASRSYAATFEPAEPPAFVPPRDREGRAFFRLVLNQPVETQQLAARLSQAGWPRTLITEREMREIAHDMAAEGLISLPEDPARHESAMEDIASAFATPNPFHRIESVGQVVAGEMRNKAILALIVSLIAIVFYIWMRFGELKFGIAAIAALTHDVLMTMGAIAVADALSGTAVGNLLGLGDVKINVEMIAAFLTIIGYSLNDTIVVFDRIRENIGGARRKIDAAVIDASINQCLSRTLLTSLTTLIVVVTLYIMGGAVIHGFAFALIVGVVVGTYSSVFVASPILMDWEAITKFVRRTFRVLTFRFN